MRKIRKEINYLDYRKLIYFKTHKLTQSQYERELEGGNIEASALYLTPEEALFDI